MAMSAAYADTTLTAMLDIGGTGVYLQLHTGSPGAAGTSNVAQYDDGGGNDPAVRKLIEFGSPANHATNTERQSDSDSEPTWSDTEINSGQTISHYSIWDAETNGNVLEIGALAESKLIGGDGITIVDPIRIRIGVFAKP